jgi:hypothetical protein
MNRGINYQLINSRGTTPPAKFDHQAPASGSHAPACGSDLPMCLCHMPASVCQPPFPCHCYYFLVFLLLSCCISYVFSYFVAFVFCGLLSPSFLLVCFSIGDFCN